MDTERIFDHSLERVLAQKMAGRAFFEAFYDHFTASSQEVNEKFRNVDMARQQSMLKKSFYHLITFFASSNADYYLEQVAISHNRLNLDIPPRLYDLWLESLIQTLADFDPLFSDQVELAWRLVLAPGIVYMAFHYQRDTPVERATEAGALDLPAT